MLLPSRVQDFINQSTIETPYLVVDLDIVSYNFNRLKRAMPRGPGIIMP